MRRLFNPYSLMTLLVALTCANAHAAELSFVHSDTQLEVIVDGDSVATFVWKDTSIPRPYWKQVIAPNGQQVTRRYPTDPVLNKDNDDHATFHPGMWMAFGDISGQDFWRNKATVEHVGFVEAPRIEDGTLTFTVRNVYRSNASIVCEEVASVEIRVLDAGTLFSFRSTFRAPTPFAFGDQEEMGFGVRLATALTVRHGGGRITNSAGGVNEQGTWGQAADWCAYSGLLDNQRTGVLLIPDPENFRRSWFHTRDYGLMVANPFGRKAMTGPNDRSIQPDLTQVEANEPFAIGFDVLVFGESDATEVDFAGLYEQVRSVHAGGVQP